MGKRGISATSYILERWSELKVTRADRMEVCGENLGKLHPVRRHLASYTTSYNIYPVQGHVACDGTKQSFILTISRCVKLFACESELRYFEEVGSRTMRLCGLVEANGVTTQSSISFMRPAVSAYNNPIIPRSTVHTQSRLLAAYSLLAVKPARCKMTVRFCTPPTNRVI